MEKMKLIKVSIEQMNGMRFIVIIHNDDEAADIFDDYLVSIGYEDTSISTSDISTKFILGSNISRPEIDDLLNEFESYSKSLSYPINISIFDK